MSATILLVEDDDNLRHNLGNLLGSLGYEVLGVATLADARRELEHGNADIVLLDVQLPDGYGPILLEETAHLITRPPIIVFTAYGDIEMAVDAMKNGAHDFLQKPVKLPQLEKSLQRAEELISLRRELAHVRQSRQAELDFIIGKSPVMKALIAEAQIAAASSASVLITGETGTGKDVLASAIYKMGTRSQKQYIAVNSAAIQNTMVESELFGYESGAFTNADKRKIGLMEVADGGILFLDEISAMPLEMQAKLLRALEERSFRRLGGLNLIKVDVQILAASNRDLPALIREGKFRDDLYYRLKVVDLHIPPLRERKQDIPELIGLFIRRSNPRFGKSVVDVSTRALQALLLHAWPGNIRELRNVIERAMMLCDDSTIDLQHLPTEFKGYAK